MPWYTTADARRDAEKQAVQGSRCGYCDEDGMVETENNGPIGPCPFCNGTKQLKRREP